MSILRRLGALRAIVILVIVVGGVVAFIFRDSLSGSANNLVVGDCFTVPAGGTVSDVQHDPCGQPHTGEVVAVFDYPNPPSVFPGLDAIKSVVTAQCPPAFQAYTGQDLQSAAAIDVGYFYPAQDNWDSDKQIICYATPVDGNPVSVSYRKSP